MKETRMFAVICISIASLFLLAGIIATKYVDSGATDSDRSNRRTGAAIFIAAIIIGGYYAFDEMLATF
jgi:hypothetical protein